MDDSRKPTTLYVRLQNSHQTGCEYVTSPLRPTLSRGCAKFCNATRQVRTVLGERSFIFGFISFTTQLLTVPSDEKKVFITLNV